MTILLTLTPTAYLLGNKSSIRHQLIHAQQTLMTTDIPAQLKAIS